MVDKKEPVLPLAPCHAIWLRCDCASPTQRGAVSLPSVVLPLERLKVGEVISAACGNRLNVIDLPSKALRGRVPVFVPMDDCPAAIHSDLCWVFPNNGLGFAPDRQQSERAEGAAVTGSVRFSQKHIERTFSGRASAMKFAQQSDFVATSRCDDTLLLKLPERTVWGGEGCVSAQPFSVSAVGTISGA